MRSRLWVSAILVSTVACQVPSAPVEPTPREVQRTPVVAVVGASVSAGFSDQMITAETREDRAHNATLPLREVLPVLWDQAVEVRDLSNLLLFQRPRKIGERQVRRAGKAEPDLVLAIDFLFWFGYSFRGGDHAERLALQEQGLGLLDRLQAPILVGDYPAMNDVDRRMMSPRMIPAEATLKELNERVRRWAADRPRVTVFPLAGLVAELRTQERRLEIAGEPVWLGPRDLLQTDRLHATRLGVAVLAWTIAGALRRHAALPAVLRPPERQLAGLIERLELTDLALAAAAREGAPAPAPVEPSAARRR